MDSKTFSLTLVLWVFIFFYFHPATSRRIQNNPSSLSPAAMLIRGFNLMPEHEINIVPEGADAPRLVERRVNFPVILSSNGSAAGPSVEEFSHHAGYYKLPRTKSASLMCLLTGCAETGSNNVAKASNFVPSRSNKTDPVVIWLTGGPGCSGSIAMFYENGPVTISNDLSLAWNDFGWDKVSNIIFVDQPAGTGFSYISDESDLRHDEEGVSNDLYDFLQAFFKEHPQFVKNDFYITGESYAGHYIPVLASRVHSGNKKREGIHINLKGLAIGNGLTNPEVQYNAYTDYALDMKLISKSDQESIDKLYPECQEAIRKCNAGDGQACSTGFFICNNIFSEVLSIAGGINHYDIRKQCEGSLCYDFSNMEKFYDQKSVKRALGVGDLPFVSCSSDVYDAMQKDWLRNHEVGIPALLEDGIKFLAYAGEYDLICNWLGNERWVQAMEWSGKKEFGSAAKVPFKVDGKEAGLRQNHGPLTFLKVHDAGHMVPMDQPKASLQMLQNWMHGKLNSSSLIS